MLKDVLEKLKLNLRNCIGNATDEASNIHGGYREFSTLLPSQSPEQVYVWCYAHVLNLVLADTNEVVRASASLFSLLTYLMMLQCL